MQEGTGEPQTQSEMVLNYASGQRRHFVATFASETGKSMSVDLRPGPEIHSAETFVGAAGQERGGMMKHLLGAMALSLAAALTPSFESAVGASRGERTGGFGVDGYGGVDVDVISPEVDPIPQAGTMVWGNGDTIVVTFNDATAGSKNSGASVSMVGGTEFLQLRPSPFIAGHGGIYGDPLVVWNAALATWFAGFLVAGCGRAGIGLWTSIDALNWNPGACAHFGTLDDRASIWADSNPDSPYFGRMYVSWNDFAQFARLYVSHSDDGVVWSPPVPVTDGFIRNVQLSGSPTDGTVVIVGMDEHGDSPDRTNWSYVSTDSGDTWEAARMGPDFVGPGAPGSCGYFWRIAPFWLTMGWGQPAVGPDGVIHYAYGGHGANSDDLGDIYYVRSADNGQTWSDPIILNSDQESGGTTEQWMPSVSVTAAGDVFVAWYDRRNTTDGSNYEYWGIRSLDNGATWLADMAVSDVISSQSTLTSPCLGAGDNYHSASGATHLITWSDGRVLIRGQPQLDVFFDQVQ